MADEFIKGLGIFTAGGLAWVVFAGWYRTTSFESPRQLIAPPPEPNTFFDVIGIFFADMLLWFTIIGTLTFWLLIPAAREAADAFGESTN
ncbi:MAG: hypothetical protein ABEJ79_03550 [Halolamina sp.]